MAGDEPMLLLEERELPEVIVDDIRSRLSFSDIVRSNFVCKRWAAASGSQQFLQLCRDRLPYRNCYLEVRSEIAIGKAQGIDKGKVPVVRFTALGSSKQSTGSTTSDTVNVVGEVEVHGWWFQHGCSADDLIWFMGCNPCGALPRQQLMVANPVTKEPLHVLPPIFESHGADSVLLYGRSWELKLAMVADPACEQQHYKVLVTGFPLLITRRAPAQAFTAIYSSRTRTWQARIFCVSRSNAADARTDMFHRETRLVALGGGLVYIVLESVSTSFAEIFGAGTYSGVTLRFMARNIHEELPEPDAGPVGYGVEPTDLPRLAYCQYGNMWPPATWKGVQLPCFTYKPPDDYHGPWPDMKLLAYLGRLLIVAFPCIYEFLPSQATGRWDKVSALPQHMMAEWIGMRNVNIVDPRFSLVTYACSRADSVKCFEEDGLLRFTCNHWARLRIIFDIRAQAWSMDPVRRGLRRIHDFQHISKTDLCCVLDFHPSLRCPRGGTTSPWHQSGVGTPPSVGQIQ